MTITIEIAEPEALMRFLDAAQPVAGVPIPPDLVTIADAIEARLHDDAAGAL